MPETIDLSTYVVFAILSLVAWPHVFNAGILAVGFAVLAVLDSRRRVRKARQSELANRKLLGGVVE